MFVIDTSLPFVARVALAATAMLTSGVSTGLVAWCGKPYVVSIRTVQADSDVNSSESKPEDGASIEVIQLETLTLTLRPRFTTIYDTAFLTEAKRPFARWELAQNVSLPRSSAHAQGAGQAREETVAETTDATGTVLGRWVVTWSDDGESGTCREMGTVQR